LEEPIAEVGGTGNSAREVTLSNNRESRVSSGLPSVVSLVVKVLNKRESSESVDAFEICKVTKRAHIDELDVRHLLGEGGKHFVDELRVREDDFFDSTGFDEVLEVTRNVGSTKERRKNVNIVGVLKDLRSKFDTSGVAIQSANDGNSVSSFSEKLDHVKST